MKPAPFELHRPESVPEVLALLVEYGDDAKVLAGGQSLVPMLALRLTRFDHVVDISLVPDLAGVERVDGWLRVGAMTRHRTAERSPEVRASAPLLADATARVGHFQIRNRGTVGGSIAHADPAAEQPAVALALDAVMEVTSTRGSREVAAADFFAGTWATALDPDELLTAVRFPEWTGRCGFAVDEVARRSGDFALAGAVAGVELDSSDAVVRAAVALFGVGATPVRAAAAERALLGGAPMDDVAAAAMAGIDPGDDLHATGEWRRQVAGVLVKRVAQQAIRGAGGG